jgi:hypothetical protein
MVMVPFPVIRWGGKSEILAVLTPLPYIKGRRVLVVPSKYGGKRN